ncbi:MAG: ABC transporter permease [Planctomycetes bacterium]|nr:ABC transporter permease [Planctomycetota bacterium]
MLDYILRRLGQAVLTIFGVMILSFLLFRVVSGDIAAAVLGPKATEQAKAQWRHDYGYDRPRILNLHKTVLMVDNAGGSGPLNAKDAPGSKTVVALGLTLGKPGWGEESAGPGVKPKSDTLMGRYVFWLNEDTPLEKMTNGLPMVEDARPETGSAQPTFPASGPQTQPVTTPIPAAGTQMPAQNTADKQDAKETKKKPKILFTLSDKSRFEVDLSGVGTCGELMKRINEHPKNGGKLVAQIAQKKCSEIFNSQFFRFLYASATFQSRSIVGDNRKLTEIIEDRANYSLALTVPAMAIEWLIGMVIACFVAYYRNTWIDKVTVLVSILGMSIPFLAFMIYGQDLMFKIEPKYAQSLLYRGNIYLPIAIMVIAGVGGMVRFYRTVILDEINRDYVRTAKAKGLPLPTILFKHVLRNCMLPILTSLIMSIPFLIMGNLLVENFFGIPGLGDLMITSIGNCNEPIMNGLVFLTALIITLGVLITDISYAIFDPRIRLR